MTIKLCKIINKSIEKLYNEINLFNTPNQQMCYRYALSVKPEIKERFNINDLPLGLETQYNIAL